MTSNKPVVALQDILDYSYCPVKLWWRLGDTEIGIEDGPGRNNTGEQLVNQSIKNALNLYYYALKNSSGSKNDDGAITPLKSLMVVWKKWLAAWEVEELAPLLLEYHSIKKELLAQFGRSGKYKRNDGSLYKQPTWTRNWKQLATSTGLNNLQKNIDSRQQNAGLVALSNDFDVDQVDKPMGLADSFYTSLKIAEELKLPADSVVLGVQEPVVLDLPSVKVEFVADMIVSNGDKRRPGRPTADGEKDTFRSISYELHLFDDSIPAPISLARDLRVLGLGEAFPKNLELGDGNKGFVIKDVLIRHMQTNRTTTIVPSPGAGSLAIDSLARATLTGVQGGVYTARMVNGWRACGNCEYRPLCFTDAGVMELFNPPLTSRIEAGQELHNTIAEAIHNSNNPKSILNALRGFSRWLSKHPGIGDDQVMWVLESLAASLDEEAA